MSRKSKQQKKFEWSLAVLRRYFFVSLRPGFTIHIPRMTLARLCSAGLEVAVVSEFQPILIKY